MKTRIVTTIFLATIVGLFAEQAAAQSVITSVARRNSTNPLPELGGTLQEASVIFNDRTHTYKSMANNDISFLLGKAEYVKVSNVDRNVATYELDIVLGTRADVYLFIDYRVGDNSNTNPPVLTTLMTWVAQMGFVDTGLGIGIDESNDGSINQYGRIYKAQFPAGTVTLKQQNDGTSRNMYGVAAVMVDATFNPPPVAAAAPKYAKTYPGVSIQLDGTITDQPPQEGDPGTLSWYWKKESGPGTVTFSPGATAEDPMATFDTKGMYTLLLQATDGTKDANDVIHVWVADRADEKLVGYWDMENTLEDKSINNNNGTLYFNKKVSAENRFVSDAAIGTASIDLNTTEASPISYFVYLGQAPELDFTTGGLGDFTVTAWVKTLSDRNVFSKGGDDTNGIRYVLAVGENGAGKVDLVTDDNATKVEALSSGVVNDGKWHFIAGQRSGDVTRVYVDGFLAGTASLPGISYNLSGTSQKGAYIGVGINQELSGVPITEPNSVNTKRFLGKIDDVRVYNYALALEDAGFESIRSLTAMGPIAASVNAGPDGSFLIKPGLSYQLAGSVTDLGKEDGKTILWTTVSGPEGTEAVFADPSSPTSTVTFLKGGVYTLKLTVIDDAGTVEDTVVITTTTPSCADVIAAGLIQKTDLNKDCYVNIQDLAILLENWTKCNDPENVNCIWPF